jgi:hypothetical protein
MLAVFTLLFAYLLTSRLNAASLFVGQNREHNARQLSQAKQALIGWVAMNAASNDANPGRLPCPEAEAHYGDPAQEGVAAPVCSWPAVGRLPWRTLGLDRLVDAAGEPLWYVVSPGWALPDLSPINFDAVGQLTVNGITLNTEKPVALIIAPGPVLAAQACGGSSAWTQTRPTTGTPDPRNYLECENAASSTSSSTSFVTDRPGQRFNDQVLRVSAADLMPALEATIPARIDRQIAPEVKKVFALDSNSPRRWVTTSTSPLYPYAAPFANPGPGAGTSNYLAVAGTYQGLLPFNQTQGCTASADNPRCLPGLIGYASTPASAQETLGYGYIMSQSCGWETANEVYFCEGQYHEYDSDPTQPVRIQLIATFDNVALGLRKIDTARMQVQARKSGSGDPWLNLSTAYRAEVNDGSVSGRPRGSVTIRFWATMPNIDSQTWGSYADFRIRIERGVISDHALLDPADATLGWFARNEWYRYLYYAAAQANTPDGLPSTTGCDSGNCLRVNDSSLRNIRALLLFTGRPLGTQVRPSNDFLNYVEFQNGDSGTLFEQRMKRNSNVAMSPTTTPSYPFYAPWNDRVFPVDWISTPTALQLSLLP